MLPVPNLPALNVNGTPVPTPPFTQAVRTALQGIRNAATEADLLFLEAWEMCPSMNLGATLRIHQIRRANPGLAAAVAAELKAVAGAVKVA